MDSGWQTGTAQPVIVKVGRIGKEREWNRAFFISELRDLEG
jgi:hypothetical protein